MYLWKVERCDMKGNWELERIYSRGITGKGVTTAVLDTGIYPHRAFLTPVNRIKYFLDFTDRQGEWEAAPYDDNGHGSHVCGIIAGNDPFFRRKFGSYPGIAPESELIVFKVLDKEGNGKMKTMINAIDWLIAHYREYNVRIVNISVGMPLKQKPDILQEQLINRVEYLWDMGLTVIVAAGNEGPRPYTITVPGISAKVITVGAYEEKRTCGRKKKRLYSGSGPVPGTCVCKPDVIAPATGIISCSNSYDGYIRRSGTSMAAPLVSGVLALLLSKQSGLSNLDLKIRLMETSMDMGLPRNRQGWGMINPEALLIV